MGDFSLETSITFPRPLEAYRDSLLHTHTHIDILLILSKDIFNYRGLIQELADYEKTPDGPKITADTLIQDGFGDRNQIITNKF